MAVDEDVSDRIVTEQRLERPEAEQLVLQFLDQAAAVGIGKQAALFVKDVVDCGGDLYREHRGLEGFEFRHVDSLEQLVVDLDLEASRAVRDRILAPAHGRADKRAAAVTGLGRTRSGAGGTSESIG